MCMSKDSLKEVLEIDLKVSATDKTLEKWDPH